MKGAEKALGFLNKFLARSLTVYGNFMPVLLTLETVKTVFPEEIFTTVV